MAELDNALEAPSTPRRVFTGLSQGEEGVAEPEERSEPPRPRPRPPLLPLDGLPLRIPSSSVALEGATDLPWAGAGVRAGEGDDTGPFTAAVASGEAGTLPCR